MCRRRRRTVVVNMPAVVRKEALMLDTLSAYGTSPLNTSAFQ